MFKDKFISISPNIIIHEVILNLVIRSINVLKFTILKNLLDLVFIYTYLPIKELASFKTTYNNVYLIDIAITLIYAIFIS